MIYILHGTDLKAAYLRYSQILAEFSKDPKIRLDKNSTPDQIREALNQNSLFETKKVIICHNLVSSKKMDVKDLKDVSENVVIIREDKLLTSASVAKFAKLAKVETFKPESKMFKFLDSLSPNYQRTVKSFASLDEEPSLLWNLQYRLLLLIFTKINLGVEKTGSVLQRHISDWQWQRAKSQASQFSLESLMALYSGSLKIEFMIKSGKTNLNPKTLLSVLFMKYLKS